MQSVCPLPSSATSGAQSLRPASASPCLRSSSQPPVPPLHFSHTSRSSHTPSAASQWAVLSDDLDDLPTLPTLPKPLTTSLPTLLRPPPSHAPATSHPDSLPGPQAWTLTPPASHPLPHPHLPLTSRSPSAPTLSRPVPRTVAKPSKTPGPPSKLFSDTDPFIQSYSELHVEVTDTFPPEGRASAAETSSSSPAAPTPAPDTTSNRTSSGASTSTSTSTSASASASRAPLAPLASFDALGARPFRYSLPLRRRMVEAGYNLPTPIQQHAIPYIHAGRDVLALAHTGTGKTAAYLIPVLGRLMKTQRCKLPRNTCYPAVLVLLPTRELAQQVLEGLAVLIKNTHLKAVMLAGGVSIVEQTLAMRDGVDLVVATPGRLVDHVSRRTLQLSRVHTLVVDEVDKMLGLGFEPELRRLLGDARLPAAPQRQTVMVSATLAPDVRGLAAALLHRHVHLQVGTQGASTPLIQHSLELLTPAQKLERLVTLLSSCSASSSPFLSSLPGAGAGGPAGMALVFTNSVQVAKKVHALLVARGLAAGLLHGELPQAARDEAITCFKFGVTAVLVATSLAARGIDVPDVSLVVNFDAPAEAEDYIHRIGRTGRAGRPGVATTLFTPRDGAAARGVVEVLRNSGQEVPGWLQALAEEAAAEAAAEQQPEGAAAAAPAPAPAPAARVPGAGRRQGPRIREWGSRCRVAFGSYVLSSRPSLAPQDLLMDRVMGLGAAERYAGPEQGDGRARGGGAGQAGGVRGARAAAMSAALLSRWHKVIHGRGRAAAADAAAAAGSGAKGGDEDASDGPDSASTSSSSHSSGLGEGVSQHAMGHGSRGAAGDGVAGDAGTRHAASERWLSEQPWGAQRAVARGRSGGGEKGQAPAPGGGGRRMLFEDGRIRVSLGSPA